MEVARGMRCGKVQVQVLDGRVLVPDRSCWPVGGLRLPYISYRTYPLPYLAVVGTFCRTLG